MKNVIVDLMVSQPVAGSQFHGGGEYAKTVFKSLCENFSDKANISVYFDSDRFMDEWVYELIKKYGINYCNVKNYDEVNRLAEFLNADVFFAGLISAVKSLDISKQTRVVGVYHGFRSLEMPTEKTAPLYESDIKGKLKERTKLIFRNRYLKKKYDDMKAMIDKCDYIIGVSEHSGYAARIFFPEFDTSKIKVYYSPAKYVVPVEGIEKIQREKYILMLGGNRWVKNAYRGMKAIDNLFLKGHLDGYTVSIVGGIPKSILNKIRNKDRFTSLGYVPAEELEKWYKKCAVFFYPTLNEGFGYPPLEAMKYGTTCVISAVNSLPEIYKDSVYYCNPYDINEMEGRILQALDSPLPEILIDSARKRIEDKQQADLLSLCNLIVDS